MFFNTKNKISAEISAAILSTVLPAFTMSPYYKDGGRFSPPYGFWLDQYIIGFVYTLCTLFMKFNFNADSMPQEKKGEIVRLVFTKTCGEDGLPMLNTVLKGEPQSSEFHRGRKDAILLFGVDSGMINLKGLESEPTLVLAKELAKNMHQSMRSITQNSSSTSSLSAAVTFLTITRHIQNVYLSPKKSDEAAVDSRAADKEAEASSALRSARQEDEESMSWDGLATAIQKNDEK